MKHTFQLLLCSLFVTLCGGRLQATDVGELNSSFVPKIFAGGEVQVTAAAAGGQLYVGGNFDWINGQPAEWLARLNADSTVDTTFNPTRIADADQLLTVVPQDDGKLLVGYFFSMKIYAMAGAQQALPDSSAAGSLTLRGSNTGVSTGTVAIGGSTGTGGTGTVITNPNIPVVPFSPFGARIVRLNTDGSSDTSFQTVELGADWASDIQTDVLTFIQPSTDSKILVGGSFQSVDGKPISNLVRLNADGTIDTTFKTTVDGTVETALRTADGGTVIGGKFSKINKARLAFGLAKLKANGTRDNAFNPQGKPKSAKVIKVTSGPNKTLLVATVTETFKSGVLLGQRTSHLDVVEANGKLQRPLLANVMGKPVGLGQFNSTTALLVTVTDNGITTPAYATFASLGKAPVPPPSKLASAQSAGGSLSKVIALAYKPNGIFHSTRGWEAYGLSGLATNATPSMTGSEGIVPPGQIASGPGFWVGSSASVDHVVAAPGGNLIVTGSFSFGLTADGSLVDRQGLAKLDASGNVDATFAPSIQTSVLRMLANTDGGVTIVGTFDSGTIANGKPTGIVSSGGGNSLFQLTAAGEVNPVFTVSDTQPMLSLINALTRQQDGKLLIGGDGYSIASTDPSKSTTSTAPLLKRFNADGTEDTSFAPAFSVTPSSDPNAWVQSASITNLQIDTDGAIIATGTFDTVNGVSRSGVVRLLTDGTVDANNLINPLAAGFTRVQPGANGGYFVTAPQLQNWPQPVLTPIPVDPPAVTPITGTPTGTGGAMTPNLVVIGPIFPPSKSDGLSPFMMTDASGTQDTTFTVPDLVPTGTWTWRGMSYGVKFAFPLADGGWVAMTYGMKNKTSGDAVSLIIINADGSLRSGYAAPEFASASSQSYGGPVWWWWGPQQPADYVQDMIQLDDGSLVVAGTFWSVNGEARSGLAKLLPVPAQLTLAPSGGSLIVGSGATSILLSTGNSFTNGTATIVGSGSLTLNGNGTLTLTPGTTGGTPTIITTPAPPSP